MKDKIKVFVGLTICFLPIFLLMLASDGVFGESVKDILGWIILIIPIVLILIGVTTYIYNKLKK